MPIKFVEALPEMTRGGRGPNMELLADLEAVKAQPGKWALLMEGKSSTAAAQLKQRWKAEGYDFASRQAGKSASGKAQYDVYVCYMGVGMVDAPEAPATPAGKGAKAKAS